MALARQGAGARIKITVTEVDEKTETAVVIIEGEDIHFDAVVDTITNLGAALHSIDEVEVENTSQAEPD